VPALVEALLRRDEDAALGIAERYVSRVGSRTAVFADLLQPAQAKLAELWYRNEIHSADELRAALIVARLVPGLPATPSIQQAGLEHHCLLVVAKGDGHVLGVWMMGLALLDDGWEVELIEEASDRDVAFALAARRPRFLGLSSGYLPSSRPVSRLVALARAHRVPVLVGGPAFNRAPELWRQVGADGHAMDSRMGVVLARRYA